MVNRGRRFGRTRAKPLVLGALLIGLLLVLLTLQARWLGQLAAAQKDQMRQVLSAGADRMAEDFVDTMSRIGAGVSTDELDPADARLIAEVIAAGSDADARVPSVSRVRFRVSPSSFAVRSSGDAIDRTIVLDERALATDLFPELARRAFGADVFETYHVCVVPSAASAGDTDPLFCSSSGLAHSFDTSPDAATDLFVEPSRWVGFFLEGDERWIPSSGESPVFASPELLDRAGSVPAAREAPWRIEVRHLKGSLDVALASARRRNLLLGGGVLALLVAGFGFAWSAEQRARRLAERELAFVAGVSHELRTPLAVIRMAASNLEQGVVRESDRIAEYGALVEREATRLGALIERVLRFSNDGERKTSLDDDVEIGRVVERAIDNCRTWCDRKSFEVRVDIGADVPRVRADRESLISAVHNLLENAIKYGPNDHEIRVRVYIDPSSSTNVVIEVADDGPGIARDERDRIFEPFYRGKDASAGEVVGSGLGLSVVSDIATAHGGRVELIDSAASGATFALHLPVTPESASPRGGRA